ncbi:MAG TPA: hypothetical protein VHA74_01640 [Candidatus Dojkabacteria bacterium]|nr:hypothetical protein [Candidatus Dojkabacteria bacterium]
MNLNDSVLLTDHFYDRNKPLTHFDLNEIIESELGDFIDSRKRVSTSEEFKDYVLANLDLVGYNENNRCTVEEWLEMSDDDAIPSIVECIYHFISNGLSEKIGYEFPIQRFFFNLIDLKNGGVSIRQSQSINNDPKALSKIKTCNDLILTIAQIIDQSPDIRNNVRGGNDQYFSDTGITFGSITNAAVIVDYILKAYPINKLVEEY